MIFRFLTALLLLPLLACGGGGGGSSNNAPPAASTNNPPPAPALPAPHSQCSLAVAKRDVLDIFETSYYFNDVPEQQAKYPTIRAGIDGYATVDALLNDLRYRPDTFDRNFTFFITVAEFEQFFREGEFFGFGFTVGVDFDGSWRLIDVFSGSAAGLAGLRRSDTIVAVNGTPAGELSLASEATFGPPDQGVQRTLTIRTVAGAERDVTLTKGVVNVDPVPQEQVGIFDVAGRKVGYVYLRTFIDQAEPGLRTAFAELAAADVDDLVLDLRYNGGGLLTPTETLGSLMAGAGRVGQTFYRLEYNAQVTAEIGGPDDIRSFHLEPNALDGFEHAYYLTGPGSASSSELTISGLSPYLDRSRVVGATTAGKPVGQFGIEYCNDSMLLFVVGFRTVNAIGEADYFGGIPADCPALDDWDHELGDPEEARFAAALGLIESNDSFCDGAGALSGGASTGLRIGSRRMAMGPGLAGAFLGAF